MHFSSRAGRILIQVMLLSSLLLGSEARPQSNGPCQIIYLVRDDKGVLLDPAKLESIAAPKGEEMTAGTTFIKNADGTLTKDVKCLKSRLDIGGKPVALSEMTLKYGGQSMRLVFNLRLVEEKQVIDSLSFQEGTFKLDKGKWVKVEK